MFALVKFSGKDQPVIYPITSHISDGWKFVHHSECEWVMVISGNGVIHLPLSSPHLNYAPYGVVRFGTGMFNISDGRFAARGMAHEEVKGH